MKKVLFPLLALVLALGLSLPMAGTVVAATINVPSDEPTIQAAIDNATSGDTINVAAGTYEPFTVNTKTDLTIQSDEAAVVQGVQVVATNYGNRDAVVFVTDSTGIVLRGLTIGPNTGKTLVKDYGVIYENSSGEITNCTVSPNTSGDMNSVAIGIWDGSEVTVDPCTIHNFGRIGVFIYNGCTASILDSTIEGQVYSGEGELCYGVEVEGAYMNADPGTGSQVTIRGNEIYNCDNTFDPSPTWGSAGILINGWLEYFDADDSTVIVENNDIHNNEAGIYVIKSPSSYAHCNNIYDNRDCGVISAAAHDDSTAVFDATMNWWGDVSGPDGVGSGSGDAVSANVDYDPWSFTPDPCEPKSKGFWKNHPGSLDAVLDGGSIWLGTYLVDYEVANATGAEPVFSNERAKCAEDMLAPQLLAAELNVLHLTHLDLYDGCEVVDNAIVAADTELEGYNATRRCSIGIKGKDKQDMLVLADVLDSFNNGEVCEWPCDWD